ncbi:MAG: sigma-54-dependent Fis family transcriptional regulator [Proteobacteria bacterium]|nr:sigma-54-dependent Fis family transcriptional regulator [Pseudomonadota bacterium]
MPESLRESVTALLARSGLRLSVMPDDPEGHGLMVICEVNEWVFSRLHAFSPRAVMLVIVVTPMGRVPDAQHWSLLQAGAADVLSWPVLPDDARAVCARFERLATVHRLCKAASVAGTLVGISPAWRSLVRQVVELAVFTGAPVLVTGESGTGKELVARLIHELDPRPAKRELVVVDCTTITPELSGSEFFGHERGAFTGALSAREGAFAQAHGGTLFLDEIGDLPLPLQAQLLRVVQEGKYKRVGANAWQDTHFRLVSATHCDLRARVAEGRFRADLYFRIAGAVCRTPPLRERRDDVLTLARHFQSGIDGSDAGRGFDELVCQYLLARDYPGNVRELKRVVERLCLRHAGDGPITIGDVPEDERPSDAGPSRATLQECWNTAAREAIGLGMGLKEIGQLATDCAIAAALEREHGNLHRAAARLNVTDRALQLRRAQQRPLQ